MEEEFQELKRITIKCYPSNIYINGEDYKLTKEDLALYYECLKAYKTLEEEYQSSFHARTNLIIKLQNWQKILAEFNERLQESINKGKSLYKTRSSSDFKDWAKILEILIRIFPTEDLALKYLKIYSPTQKERHGYREVQDSFDYIGLIAEKNLLDSLDSTKIFSTAEIINLLRHLYTHSHTLILATDYEHPNMIIPNLWPKPKSIIPQSNINLKGTVLGYKVNDLEKEAISLVNNFLTEANYDLEGLEVDGIVKYLQEEQKKVRKKA